MEMPNFLVIGAAKAGTSSLYYYLRQHPQIFMPSLKEPRFFALEGQKLDFKNPDQFINHDSVTTLQEYQKLFEDVTDEIAVGEASPLYLYSEKAANRIKHYLPEVKLIVVLRNPIERAFSCYTHLLREGYETSTFEDGVKLEDFRISQNWAHLWHYKSGGYYYKQLVPYFERFEKENIKVYLFEDLCQGPNAVLKDIFTFLGVDSSFQPDMTKQNVSGLPKNMLIQKLVSRKNLVRSLAQAVVPTKLRRSTAEQIRKWNLGEKPSLSEETRKQLADEYREDVLQLQHLIQRDLSAWLV